MAASNTAIRAAVIQGAVNATSPPARRSVGVGSHRTKTGAGIHPYDVPAVL